MSQDLVSSSPEFVSVAPWSRSAVFVDWLKVRVPNSGQYSGFSQACTLGIDEHGEIEWMSPASTKFEGSFSTRARVRVHPDFLEIDFNPSRFFRDDNLFGYTVEQCLEVVDELLAAVDRPPLDRVQATFSRLDLTANVVTGSAGALEAYIRFAMRQKMPRMTTRGFDGMVVYRNKSKSISVYEKHREMLEHGVSSEHRERLVEFLKAQGVARVELRLGNHFLRRNNLRRVALVTQERLEELFMKEVDQMPKESDEDVTDTLTESELGSLLAWQRGYDVKKLVSKNTYYKRRKAIKEKTGYDIGGESPLVFKQKSPKIRTYTLEMPGWYELPPVYPGMFKGKIKMVKE